MMALRSVIKVSFRNLKYIDIANMNVVKLRSNQINAHNKMRQDEDKRSFKDILKDKINGMGKET